MYFPKVAVCLVIWPATCVQGISNNQIFGHKNGCDIDNAAATTATTATASITITITCMSLPTFPVMLRYVEFIYCSNVFLPVLPHIFLISKVNLSYCGWISSSALILPIKLVDSLDKIKTRWGWDHIFFQLWRQGRNQVLHLPRNGGKKFLTKLYSVKSFIL